MTPELANKIITLAVLKNMVTRLDGEVRTAARESMSPGDRKAGSASGQRIGYVTLTDPEGSYRVTDGEAFRAWVREHRPEEIVAVESVRSSYVRSLAYAKGGDTDGFVHDYDLEVVAIGLRNVSARVSALVREKAWEERVDIVLDIDGQAHVITIPTSEVERIYTTLRAAQLIAYAEALEAR